MTTHRIEESKVRIGDRRQPLKPGKVYHARRYRPDKRNNPHDYSEPNNLWWMELDVQPPDWMKDWYWDFGCLFFEGVTNEGFSTKQFIGYPPLPKDTLVRLEEWIAEDTEGWDCITNEKPMIASAVAAYKQLGGGKEEPVLASEYFAEIQPAVTMPKTLYPKCKQIVVEKVLRVEGREIWHGDGVKCTQRIKKWGYLILGRQNADKS